MNPGGDEVGKWLENGGVATPRDYRAAGVKAGIKEGSEKEDVALVVSERPARAAAVFTTNRVQAAPIQVDREHLADGGARAVVLNSGNANACTGTRGLEDARRMCQVAAEALGLAREEVLVCSTGVIGVPLPMEVVEAGVRAAVRALSPQGGSNAAKAIMTTDTVAKECALEGSAQGVSFRIGGMAKGSGMIAPHMATMLSVITTDAAVPAPLLDGLLRRAVERSFNCITVDGDMSTNDTVILLANGAAGGAELAAGSPAAEDFARALEQVCRRLSRMIARDGEGATKLVLVRVSGAADGEGARRMALAVANSTLVKTALFGNDPNWGRILCAMGYAGVPFDPDRAEVALCGVPIYAGGAGAAFDEEALRKALQTSEVEIRIRLDQGDGSAEIFTCDLSYDYVRINAEYTT